MNVAGQSLFRKHFFVKPVDGEQNWQTYERGALEVSAWANANEVDVVSVNDGSFGPDYVCNVWYYASKPL